jgi:PAS domain S-box-containing protein
VNALGADRSHDAEEASRLLRQANARAEDALEGLRHARSAERLYRSLIDAAPDAVVVIDGAGEIILVNLLALSLFGYTREEMIGHSIELLVPVAARARHGGRVKAYLTAPEARAMRGGLQLEGLRKDGEVFPVEISLSPVQTAEGLVVSCCLRDTTERHRAEEVRARLAALVSSSDDAIIGKSLDGAITSWNKGAERIFGYTEQEVLGRTIALLSVPGSEAADQRVLAAVARGEVQRFDAVRRRKDGREIHVSVTTSPIHDASGRVVGASKVARDITERRSAEEALARARDTAEAASRELESFSYSVAHDLRAPLRAMSGFAQVVLEDYGERLDEEGRGFLQASYASAVRMGELIDALLALAGVTSREIVRERLDLSALARACLAELAAASPRRHVEVVVEDDLTADADPVLMCVLLQNLLGNAWKFTAHAHAARIEVGAVAAGEGRSQRAFFVRDNGAGFEMGQAGKLFAPFRRLHAAAEFPGTGIGLATVQRIVHRHGGRIRAEGDAGRGAVFTFTLSSGGLPESREPLSR